MGAEPIWALLLNLLLAGGGVAAVVLLLRQVLPFPADPEGWELHPREMEPDRLRTVAVEPALMLGERTLSVDCWAPLSPVSGKDFRRSKNALMLSAAIALTEDRLPPSALCRHREWLGLMHIDGENFRRKHPVIDTALVDGQEGPLVLDGLRQRAYFTGGRELALACSAISDGEVRIMTREEKDRLALIPEEAFFYATCSIDKQKAGPLVFLGAVLPTVRQLAQEDFSRACAQLGASGVEVRFQPCEEDVRLRAEQVWGGPLPWAQDGPGTLWLMRRSADSADFAAPVSRMFDRRKARVARKSRGTALGAAIGLAAVLLGSHPAATVLCLAALLLRLWVRVPDRLGQPAAFSRQNLLWSLPAAAVLPLAVGIAARVLLPVEALWALSSAMLAALSLPPMFIWFYVENRRRLNIAWIACVAAVWLAALVAAPLWALAGTALGGLCGYALVKALSAA